MDFEPQIGSIIEFDAGDEHRLAIVTGTVGKKKLVIHTASGDEMRTTLGDITFALGSGPADDLSRAEKKLQDLADSIAQRQNDVELEILWEFVREEDSPMKPSELADLIFSNTESATVLAVIRALREDLIFFKGRRDGLYEPRPDGQVEDLREQERVRLRKEREYTAVLQAIVDVLELPEEERASRIGKAMGEDDALRNSIYLLQDFAAQGEEFFRRDEAQTLLDDLADLLGRQLKGRLGLKAFHLMVELGLWTEHQNLCLRRYHIDPHFSEEILAAAKELAQSPWQPEPWREDLTYLTCITIDAPHSRDLDDALSCQPTIEGGWEVGIHVADPSALVTMDSLLDREARKRATSVYLPTGSIPMFPRSLSEDKFSLVEDKVRPAMTTRVIFDENLEIIETEIVPSLIQVNRRLSYVETDELLESDDSGRFEDLVQNLKYIADHCYTRRVDQGAFSFDLPDTKVVVDDSTDPPTVEVSAVETDTASHALVSELMILNNEMVGRFCTRNEIPVIYRNQESPDDPLVDDEILAIPEGPARAFAQIRRMKRGEISTVAALHFGLGIYGYAQASSPIRRYSDLICQRQIKAFLSDHPLPYDDEGILEVLAAIDATLGDASDTERETNRYWLLYDLAQKEEPLDAIVVEHKDPQGSRVSVFLTYCAYRSNGTLRSAVPVGGEVEVVVERANPRRDALTLRQA